MSEEKVEQGCEQEALWHVMNLPIKVEQPKVGELPPRPKLVAYPAHGSGLIAFFDVDDTERYISEVSSQLLAEQQVSAGMREDLEQLRSLAKTKEVCGHSTSWQCAGEGGFYCLMCRAEAAEASLTEAIAQRDEATTKLDKAEGLIGLLKVQLAECGVGEWRGDFFMGKPTLSGRLREAEVRLAAFTCVNPKE